MATTTTATLETTTRSASAAQPLLKVDGLSVTFFTPTGAVHAVRDASFEIKRGEVVGLVGESGCGKSTMAYAIMGYLPGEPEVGGAVYLDGQDMAEFGPAELRKLRGNRIAMVYQDPALALNPTMKVGHQILEAISEHLDLDAAQAAQRMAELIESVGLPDPERIAESYPHQLSGGQQQRIVIAMALACDPDLLLMDEPTTGLDVTTEATILDLVADLKGRVNAGILYVSHNLGVVARIADRVVVMYAGQTVEEAPVRDLFKDPRHPYTVGLLSCVPKPVADEGAVTRLQSIQGSVFPSTQADPGMCLFSDRCPMATDRCTAEAPEPVSVSAAHGSRCFYPHDVSPDLWNESVEREAPHENGKEPTLTVKGLHRVYGKWQRKYLFFGPKVKPPVRAVENVDFNVGAGRTVGIVGESGSGKSTVARSIVGLVPRDSGDVELRGEELSAEADERNADQKGSIRMVFQNPTSSLNPKLPVRHNILRPLQKFTDMSAKEREERACELLESVGLDASYMDRQPLQLSGGQQQRVALAAAFAGDPELIVADEPVSALDVSVQAQVLNLLEDHQREKGTSYVFISHDLGVVRYVSDEILVLYAGHVAECGPAEDVLSAPSHPYTEALLSAAPIPDPDAIPTPIRLGGSVPKQHEQFKGCFFASRCPRKIGDICDNTPPPVQTSPGSPTHEVHCHIPLDELERLQSSPVESRA
ncbi:MAG: ABC transporter ATP-binding protein [Chloroflexota bacterium]|nr:ABC transporter ATP-binding protein [Chloroflexota bacterium]MDE2885060.1 ABC transporter ATP-binding protein [Chloroflexota bacterium]